MKQKKTIFLYASTSTLDKNINHKELKCHYEIIGESRNIRDLDKYGPSSIDYIVIFANRKRINNLDKSYINYLFHVFNLIVVVGKAPVHILNNYVYIPLNLTQNKLQNVLKMIENGIDKPVKYSYKNYYRKASELLEKLGLNKRNKGFDYLVYCSYNIATIEEKCNLQLLYNFLADKYSTTFEAVERAIRFAINSVSQSALCEIFNMDKSACSNKKFIIKLNKYVIDKLL